MPIPAGRSRSTAAPSWKAPTWLSKILARLQLKPGQRVLEIGTGSGFMTAIIARRVERVFSLERYRTLVQQAQNCLDDLSIRNVVIRQADGSNGLVGEGTFDRIVSTAAFTTMPRFFAEQIVSGGMMIAPIILTMIAA